MVRVNSWKKSGLHRLYVNTDEGDQLGWGNAVNGQMHIDADVDPNVVWSALAGHADWPIDAVRPKTQRPAQDATERKQVKGYDLAENEPGKAARVRAEGELADLAKMHPNLLNNTDLEAVDRSSGGAWSRGADQEQRVALYLDKMKSQGWFVLHSVPLGNTWIDHLLIGPTGVFVVNTMMRLGQDIFITADTVAVNGDPTNCFDKVRMQTELSKQILQESAGFEVPVYACVVVMNGTENSMHGGITHRGSPKDIIIAYPWNLNFFGSYRQRMDLIRASLVYELARRSSTWT